MSKAVLVIDMPKRCKDCFRYRADAWFGGSCTQAKEENGWNKHIDADEEYNVQNWCPLRPYQETIPIEWIEKQIEEYYEDGYNSYGKALNIMLADWRKENETNK